MFWSVSTFPGSMLSSTISNMDLDNRGHFVKLIPSLTGSSFLSLQAVPFFLYKQFLSFFIGSFFLSSQLVPSFLFLEVPSFLYKQFLTFFIGSSSLSLQAVPSFLYRLFLPFFIGSSFPFLQLVPSFLYRQVLPFFIHSSFLFGYVVLSCLNRQFLPFFAGSSFLPQQVVSSFPLSNVYALKNFARRSGLPKMGLLADLISHITSSKHLYSSLNNLSSNPMFLKVVSINSMVMQQNLFLWMQTAFLGLH